MLSTLITGAFTLVLGFIIGWLTAWIVVARRPNAPSSAMWRSVLLVAGILAVLLLAVIVSPLVGLSSLTGRAAEARITSQPTYTPYPTYTPIPVPTLAPATPIPAARAAPPPAPAAQCITWTDAAAHMGETTCVRGTVYSTYQSGSTFFIDFDNTRASFYGVSFRQTWADLRGRCVQISGKISPYNGRPQIIIDNKEQMKECP